MFYMLKEYKSVNIMTTTQPDNTQTTEERLIDVRATMRYYRPAQTFGRQHGRINGYYYTEPTDNGRV